MTREQIKNESMLELIGRSRVIKKRRKMINYLIVLLLCFSLALNLILMSKFKNNSPHDFSDITYGENYDEEVMMTKILLENCIRSCIGVKIEQDTHRTKDENNVDTGHYYYNFTKYGQEIFQNYEVLLNDYDMTLEQANTFINSICNFDKKRLKKLIAVYGSEMFNDEKIAEQFSKNVDVNINEISPEEKRKIKSDILELADYMTCLEYINNSKEVEKGK